MAAFSTTDAAIINHQVELDSNAQAATAASSGRSIHQIYDIQSTAQKIYDGRFLHVALQFPDEALVDSVPVFWALKRQIRALYSQHQQQEAKLPELYILADTSYGSCCVDEVAAQHVNADLVVHYGHTCLSPTARLPVIYVFTKQTIDVQHASTSLSQMAADSFFTEAPGPSALVLTYDVAWEHAAKSVFDGIRSQLQEKGISTPFIMTEIDTRRNYDDKLAGRTTSSSAAMPACCQSETSCCKGNDASQSCASSKGDSCQSGTCTSSTQIPLPKDQPSVEQQRKESPLGPSRTFQLPEGVDLSWCSFLYLGPESLSLTNLILTLGPAAPIISYDPLFQRARVETGTTNRLLMKRYTHVLKARDASMVGLLVGTLGVHSYLPLLAHLRSLLTARNSGRKVYTISAGKLNPAKLANFQEIDIFVLIACPENSLVDSKEFYKPIVTPFEMELAIRAQGGDAIDWTGKYVLDLDRLVPDEVREKLEKMELRDEEEGQQSDEEEDEDQPHFSLITGKYVHRRKFERNEVGSTKAIEDGGGQLIQTGTPGVESHTVAIRQSDGTLTTILQSASTTHLEHRGWKGLEQRLGQDEPSVLEEGREGIAKGYASAEGVKEGTS